MNHKVCCVEGCKSSSSREQDKGVTFHRLSKESLTRQAWICQGRLEDKIKQVLNSDEDAATSAALKTPLYVCSRHFRKVDFELKIDKGAKFVLKTEAVPTIFPWGVTQLDDLPKLYPAVFTTKDIDIEAVQPIATAPKESNTIDKVGEKIEEPPEIEPKGSLGSSTVTLPILDKLKEGYSSSADTESDKEAFEGNLVIDEAALVQSESVTKKRRRKRTILKSIIRRQRKPRVDPSSIINAVISPVEMSPKSNISSSKPVAEAKDAPLVPIEKQHQVKKKRVSRKKIVDSNTIPQISTLKNNAGGGSFKSEDSSDTTSPMLKALIEKPSTPMVHPKASTSSSETLSVLSGKKLSPGGEKSLMIPGAIVEAKDFSEQWYRAKIVEVDHDEKEVLIHYDNWSQRYDEWISMASPRLRLVAPPQRSPRIPAKPIIYSQGERCLARWSDNRRFPATIQAVLPDDKYQILFDDGFVRTMKWQHLAKGQASMQTAALFSPLPYGSRRTAPSLPAAPSTPPPPPLHNHLFDPKRDHLGSKEERRDKKRKINVKELFSLHQGKRRRSDNLEITKRKRMRRGSKGAKETDSENADVKSDSIKVETPDTDNQSAKTDPEAKVPAKLESEPTVVKDEPSERMSTPSIEQPPQSSAPLDSLQLKQLLDTPSPVSVLKQQLLSKQKKPSEDSAKKVHQKASSPAVTVLNATKVAKEAVRKTNECLPLTPEDMSRLLKDEWSCKWVDNQPVGEVTVLPPLERGTRAATGPDEDGTTERLERMTVKVDDYRLPPLWTKFLTRRCVGNSAGKWDVVLMCPQGRRYRSKAEIGARLLEPDGPSLLPFQTCLQDFSVHRKLARRLGWDITSSGSPITTPIDIAKKKTLTLTNPKVESQKKKPEGSPEIKSKSKLFPSHSAQKLKTHALFKKRAKGKLPGTPRIKMGPAKVATPAFRPETSVNSTPVGNTSLMTELISPPVVIQPPLEDGYIMVGSFKVQIIGTLLRCPKEGCFKNFRKDNLLQMHIKHYHPEMVELLGETPNVADLAYARTIVEDATPLKSAEKQHRPRDKKTPLTPLTLKSEFEGVATKEEILTDGTGTLKPLELFTPKKEMPISDALEHSPKLRNLLLESKIESPSKTAQKDVEDMLTTFQIVQEHDKGTVKIKQEKISSTKPSKSKHSKSKKPDREMTKSQVVALINKIAEGGDRSRSQSPENKIDDRRMGQKRKVLDDASFDHKVFSNLNKSKKKRKHRDDNDADFKPSASSKKKKKSSSYLDIWNAFVTKTDSRSSLGVTSDPITPEVQSPADVSASNADAIQTERNQNENQTFINDNGERIKIVHMKREEIINCYCGFGEEDGLMIQCELCLCWQHGACQGIEKESQVPEKYICHICLYPTRARRSQRHLNNQDWLYEGRLPRAEYQANANDPNILNCVAAFSAADMGRAQALKKSHQLCGNLLHVAKVLHSLRCKLEVSQKKDHPKLYLWSKSWDDKEEYGTNQNNVHIHNNDPSNAQMHGDHLHPSTDGDGDMGDSGNFHLTEQMIEDNIGPYGDIIIDEVKLEVGESIEVSEVNEMDESEMVKCENVMDLGGDGGHNMNQGGLLSSPGGTPIHLPITNMELKTLVKSVEVCAPQPEAAIDPLECRQTLLQHIENMQMLLDARLDSIEAQIAELESQDPSLADDETPESYPRTKQTMQMLIRDLQTMEELGAVS